MNTRLSLTNRLIAASIRHRLAVIVGTLVLVAGGAWAFLTMNADAFPDLTPNQVLVMTTVPGLSPEEVEQQVTYPMEVTMLGLPRTLSVRSASKASLSVVTVTFEDDVDFYWARVDIDAYCLAHRATGSMRTSVGAAIGAASVCR